MVTVVQSASNATSSGPGAITITSAPTQNNVLLAWVLVAATAIPTAASGWTAVGSGAGGGTGQGVRASRWFWKVAGSGESTSQTPAATQSVAWAASIIEYSGVDTTTPVDVDSVQIVAGAATFTTPTITPTASADREMVTGYGIRVAVTTGNWSAEQIGGTSTGVTEETDFGATSIACQVGTADKEISSTSGTYNGTATSGQTTTVGTTGIIALKASGPAAATPLPTASRRHSDPWGLARAWAAIRVRRWRDVWPQASLATPVPTAISHKQRSNRQWRRRGHLVERPWPQGSLDTPVPAVIYRHRPSIQWRRRGHLIEPPWFVSAPVARTAVGSYGSEALSIGTPAKQSPALAKIGFEAVTIGAKAAAAPAIGSYGLKAVSIATPTRQSPTVGSIGRKAINAAAPTRQSPGVGRYGIEVVAVATPARQSPGVGRYGLEAQALGAPARQSPATSSLGFKVVAAAAPAKQSPATGSIGFQAQSARVQGRTALSSWGIEASTVAVAARQSPATSSIGLKSTAVAAPTRQTPAATRLGREAVAQATPTRQSATTGHFGFSAQSAKLSGKPPIAGSYGFGSRSVGRAQYVNFSECEPENALASSVVWGPGITREFIYADPPRIVISMPPGAVTQQDLGTPDWTAYAIARTPLDPAPTPAALVGCGIPSGALKPWEI